MTANSLDISQLGSEVFQINNTIKTNVEQEINSYLRDNNIKIDK